MKDATNEAKEYKGCVGDEYNGCVGDIGISVARSWQKRGYTSLNGVITAISIDNVMIVDLEVLNTYCKQWHPTYIINGYSGIFKRLEIESRGNCTGNGSNWRTIFQRSIEERDVRYPDYYKMETAKHIPMYDSQIRV